MSDGIYAIIGVGIGALASLSATKLQMSQARDQRIAERAGEKVDLLIRLSVENYDVINDLLRDMLATASPESKIVLTDEMKRRVAANSSAIRAIARTTKNVSILEAAEACNLATDQMLNERSLGRMRMMRDKYHAFWDLLGEIEEKGGFHGRHSKGPRPDTKLTKPN